jgi:hypothetical protein
MLLHRIKQKLCIYHKSSLIPIECDYNVCKCCPVVIASGITDIITLLTAFKKITVTVDVSYSDDRKKS